MLLLLFCLSAAVRAEIRTAVIDKQTGQLSVVDGYREDFVAWANFTDDIDASGWVFLKLMMIFSICYRSKVYNVFPLRGLQAQKVADEMSL